MPNPSYFLAAVLALLASVWSPLLRAQLPPTLPAYLYPASVIKEYSYQQTGPNTVVDYQPTLTVVAQYYGPPPADHQDHSQRGHHNPHTLCRCQHHPGFLSSRHL
ncbi:MAG: hypothetical protein NTV51_20120 [Verrucomicrobia bacterium]|nr:hypothetical protein [Verrucomicrobiota bacterium]